MVMLLTCKVLCEIIFFFHSGLMCGCRGQERMPLLRTEWLPMTGAITEITWYESSSRTKLKKAHRCVEQLESDFSHS